MALLSSDGGTTEGVVEQFALPESVRPALDGSIATWVTEAIGDESPGLGRTVGGFIPTRFEAYARVLHPALRRIDDVADIPVRWADVAAETGRTMHRLAQFERIAAIPDDPSAQPSWGVRPYADGVCRVATPLLPILRADTSSAERCVFGVWEGYGGMDMVPAIAGAPRARCPGRTYAIFTGPLDGFLAFCHGAWQPPSIWWPEDHAWFVWTEIDLDSTYVGAGAACIDAILEDPVLEAFPAYPDDRIDIGADEINPPFGGGLR